MTHTFKLSIAAMEARRYGEIAAFAAHVNALAREARSAGSTLLLLPELTCLGLLFSDPRGHRASVSDLQTLYLEVLSPFYAGYIDVLRNTASDFDLTIAGASFRHIPEHGPVNTALVAFADGRVIEQDKLHPTRDEEVTGTRGGTAASIFTIDGIPMAMPVCYDIQFPELIRVLARAGAEVLLVPSLTRPRGVHRVRHCAHARAIENQCYVCVAPLIGRLEFPVERPVDGRGCAFVACPIDDVFGITDGTYASAGNDTAELLHVELDMEKIRRSREEGEIKPFRQRRPDLYRAICDELVDD